MKKRWKLLNFIKAAVSCILLLTAVCCVLYRLPQCFTSEDSAVLAAAFTLTDGEYMNSDDSNGTDSNTSPTQAETSGSVKQTENQETAEKERDKSDYYDSFAKHTGEAKYSIAEQNITGNGTAVENFFVNNKTGLDLDFKSILNEKLTFDVKKGTDSPQVLIYHTHTSEAYMDEDVDFFYESFYSRTQNNDFNVVAVGEIIEDTLESKGIKTLHDKTVHDSTYNGAYDRSVQTVLSDMDEYKDIKVVIDIHRDALGTEEQKIKPVFEYNGRKGAQIMILSGCDINGERGFDNWQNNLNFALKIQDTAEEMYPGMTRPLSFGNFAYNEYVCDGSLLIEVGTEANSIDEAEYTAELLANVLYKVLA